jgi:hypothetical protein
VNWLVRLVRWFGFESPPETDSPEPSPAPVIELPPPEETVEPPTAFAGSTFKERFEAKTETARVRLLAEGRLYDPYARALAKRKAKAKAKAKDNPLTRHSTRLVFFKGDVMQRVELKPDGHHDDPEVQFRDFPLYTKEDRDAFVGEVLLAFDKLIEKYEAHEQAKRERIRLRARRAGQRVSLPPST